jgi:N-acetyl-anhydromuramyl-L-alanine amidase AmpD
MYGSTHSDPGPYFPWDKFKDLVKKHLEPNKNEQTK